MTNMSHFLYFFCILPVLFNEKLSSFQIYWSFIIPLLYLNKKDMRHSENNYQNNERNSKHVSKYIKCDRTEHPTQKRHQNE